MKTLVSVALMAVGLILTSGSRGETPTKELKRFDGTWQGVTVTLDGYELPSKDAEKVTLTVKGSNYTLKVGSDTIEGTHKLDPSKSPKTIDALRTAGPDKGMAILGIYELTADAYKACFAPTGNDRPTEFTAKAGSGNRLFVMKRQKP